MDVDKWDYLKRDAYHLGTSSNFDHRRYMKFAKVLQIQPTMRKEICVREKVSFNFQFILCFFHKNRSKKQRITISNRYYMLQFLSNRLSYSGF